MALKLEHKEFVSLTRVGSVAAISANRLVKPGASPDLIVTCTANARAIGAVVEACPVGLPVNVQTFGIVPITAGAALATPFTDLVSDATGRVVAAGVSGAQNIVGYNLGTTGGAGELVSVMLCPVVKYAEIIGGGIADATITVGAETAHPGHAITCSIQLKDINGTDLAVVGVVPAYLSTDSAGKDINATVTPTADLTKGTDGSLSILTAYQSYLLISEADGDIDVTLTKTDGAATVYLNLVLPTGKIVTSGAITFSA